MGLDGPLGEHIRLAFQLAVLVNDFQRAEQIVAGIIGKGQPVRPVIDKSVLEADLFPSSFLALRSAPGS
jgi:hypothetical protein